MLLVLASRIDRWVYSIYPQFITGFYITKGLFTSPTAVPYRLVAYCDSQRSIQ
jgi:hypothetical protein